MKREYAQEPPIVSVAQLNAAESEVLLREKINAETRTVYEPEAKQITVYTAEEYTLILPARDGLEEIIKGNLEEWLTVARARELEQLLPSKLEELSAACYAAIIAGCSVTLSDETKEHFALEETDQINLTAALTAVEQGAAGYPYHADGKLCRLYTAADITLIAKAATAHKLYHTTYCNHLNTWARRAKTGDELAGIFYGATLPEDLAANMAEVISNATTD